MTIEAMKFQVIVGNLGTVYDGNDRAEAMRDYNESVKIFKQSASRVTGEPVTLMVNGEPEEEYEGDYRGGDGYDIH